MSNNIVYGFGDIMDTPTHEDSTSGNCSTCKYAQLVDGKLDTCSAAHAFAVRDWLSRNEGNETTTEEGCPSYTNDDNKLPWITEIRLVGSRGTKRDVMWIQSSPVFSHEQGFICGLLSDFISDVRCQVRKPLERSEGLGRKPGWNTTLWREAFPKDAYEAALDETRKQLVAAGFKIRPEIKVSAVGCLPYIP